MIYWVIGIMAYLAVGYVLVRVALKHEIIEDDLFLMWSNFFIWPLTGLIFGTIHGLVAIFDSDTWRNLSKWFWRIK